MRYSAIFHKKAKEVSSWPMVFHGESRSGEKSRTYFSTTWSYMVCYEQYEVLTLGHRTADATNVERQRLLRGLRFSQQMVELAEVNAVLL